MFRKAKLATCAVRRKSTAHLYRQYEEQILFIRFRFRVFDYHALNRRYQRKAKLFRIGGADGVEQEPAVECDFYRVALHLYPEFVSDAAGAGNGADFGDIVSKAAFDRASNLSRRPLLGYQRRALEGVHKSLCVDGDFGLERSRDETDIVDIFGVDQP